jgi:hypothetical protein
MKAIQNAIREMHVRLLISTSVRERALSGFGSQTRL